MAEVGADHECILRVLEIRYEDAAHLLLLGAAVVPDEDGHDGRELVRGAKSLLHALVDVGRMHLERVLGDVLSRGNVIETTSFFHPLNGVTIDSEVAERGLILVERRNSTTDKVVRVRWAEEEDTLGLAQVETAVGPGRAWPRVGEAGMAGMGSVDIQIWRQEGCGTHGAMITLAPGIGSEEPLMVSGTSAR